MLQRGPVGDPPAYDRDRLQVLQIAQRGDIRDILDDQCQLPQLRPVFHGGQIGDGRRSCLLIADAALGIQGKGLQFRLSSQGRKVCCLHI